MIYAIKGNKQLQIEAAEKATYLKLGYDIAEASDGKLETVETSPAKTVSAKQFEVLQQENTVLKELLEAAGDPGQLEKLQKENKSLKDKLTEANKEVEALKAQITTVPPAGDPDPKK